MNKSVLMVGTKGHISGAAFLTTDELLARLGNNAGNLLFQHACFHSIDEKVFFPSEDFSWNMSKMREQCRVLVVPSANFIQENRDFTKFVDFLDKVNLPLLFLGLGAQADSYEKREFDFHPSVKRMISLIKERSKSVSVRGKFTAELLNRYGIDNTVVTGCPTNFINPSPNLGQEIAAKLNQKPKSLIVNAGEPWPKERIKREVERRLYGWLLTRPGMLVQQAVPAFIDYLRRKNRAANAEAPDRRAKSLSAALFEKIGVDEFEVYADNRIRTFISVDQWLEDASHYDVSIGLRMHGNMAAWQSGTPALWIYHDSRTQELAEAMDVPRIELHEFLEKIHAPEDIVEHLHFDPLSYDRKRLELMTRYVDVLSNEGIQPSSYMSKMCSAS